MSSNRRKDANRQDLELPLPLLVVLIDRVADLQA